MYPQCPPCQAQCQVDGNGRPIKGSFARETKAGIDSVRVLVSGGLIQWLAPSMSCAEVWRIKTFADGQGNVTDSSELRLDSRSSGEPDASLFAVAPDYEEVGPTEAFRRQLKFTGSSDEEVRRLLGGPEGKPLARMETQYASLKPR